MAAPVSSSSCSTARSQRVSWLSAPEAAKIESSVGCHSMEVIGALCHENEATGAGTGVVLIHLERNRIGCKQNEGGIKRKYKFCYLLHLL